MDMSLILNQTLKISEQYANALEAAFLAQSEVATTRPEALLQMQYQVQNYFLAINCGSALSKATKDLASSVIGRM